MTAGTPDDVTFGSAEEDAARRDFTINGMFYDPTSEQLIDYVGGRADLEAGRIRAIGDAEARFAEDKLRMLRAVRFAARFDFEIEPATCAAVQRHAAEIALVSPERIAKEMEQMLLHPRRRLGMNLLRDVGLLSVLLPQVAAWADADSAGWERTGAVLDALQSPTFPLALAALLHGLDGAAEVAARQTEEIARAWRLSNHDVFRAAWLVANQRVLDQAAQQPWSQVQRVLIEPGSGELLALVAALRQVAGAAQQDVEFARAKLQLPQELLDPPPILTGQDLIEHGVPRGPAFKMLLDRVRDAQLDKTVHDKATALALVDELRGLG